MSKRTKSTVRVADLAGSKELAEHIGSTRDSVKQRHKRGSLPAPVAVLACGPIWDLADFEAAP